MASWSTNVRSAGQSIVLFGWALLHGTTNKNKKEREEKKTKETRKKQERNNKETTKKQERERSNKPFNARTCSREMESIPMQLLLLFKRDVYLATVSGNTLLARWYISPPFFFPSLDFILFIVYRFKFHHNYLFIYLFLFGVGMQLCEASPWCSVTAQAFWGTT